MRRGFKKHQMAHTLIFDIGKTNKKAFLFDAGYQEISKIYTRFEEQRDEEGFPCDDLAAIRNWMLETIQAVFQSKKYEVNAINFSTYGASFVHLDNNGKPLTPLYNYLKPMPKDVSENFYGQYGDEFQLARTTASPPLGMLNSGLQLYWIKHTQPEVFKKIRWSLHFPQYLSYLLTGIPVSEYTSIGCHTALWDFSKNDYHDWVHAEGVGRILPAVVSTDTSINKNIFGKKVKVGVGIHDSSSALLPYIRADKKPFLLISTGTWSVSLNPFNNELPADKELEKDCLNFMRVNGKPVKAARLFLGEEYKRQTRQLQSFFGKGKNAHKKVAFDEKQYEKAAQNDGYYFAFEHLQTPWAQPPKSRWQHFENFEAAYHQLMWELVQLQVEAANLAIGPTPVQKIYIDGGFADNQVYVQMLARHFKGLKLRTTQSPSGSASGAAMVISGDKVKKKFLKRNYALKKRK